MSTLDVRSLCEAFQRTAAARPDAVALRSLGGGTRITWGEYAARVARIGAGLHRLGVRPGDTVALMMTNRPEFNLCDTAAMHLGAAPFSVYNTLPPDQIAHLFRNAGNRVALCEAQFAGRVCAAATASGVEHIVCVDGAPEGTVALDRVEADGGGDPDLGAAWRRVGPADLLTLIYTSGTTGPPKGVEITHGNMLAQLRATTSLLPVLPGDRTISYLPSAHIADRWAAHYTGMAFGVEVTACPDPRAVGAALPEVRPTVWGAVPRVWERLHAGLEAAIATGQDEERRRAMRWAIDCGLRRVRAEQAEIDGEGPGPDPALLAECSRADELVLAPLRERLGLDRARWLVSGAAPIAAEILEYFAALGLPILELWGMSEISCCGTINVPGRARIGTVGVALRGVEVRLAADGELLVRGDTVMRGYRNQPERTAEAIDADGWLHTGDIATIDGEGYVSIVDRKKELIINASGKNMSPANIETTLKTSSPLIGQAVCIGDRRPYNTALLVLDPDGAAAWAAAQGLEGATLQALAAEARLRAALEDAVAAANRRLSRVEQIKRFAVLPEAWEPGGDELTPTMKLKRRPIAEKYAAEIESLYA
ncbi:MAG: long-chain acyl-CoA synthetase [Chloroflexota bacterium]|jgi:long-subunit acyl-CoA synthetase (AMP-forming)|nr:long-chain acyl-CoA synthetase [Chloroflexota bacterium]